MFFSRQHPLVAMLLISDGQVDCGSTEAAKALCAANKVTSVPAFTLFTVRASRYSISISTEFLLFHSPAVFSRRSHWL